MEEAKLQTKKRADLRRKQGWTVVRHQAHLAHSPPSRSQVLREWMKTSPSAYSRGLEELKRRDALERLVCFKSILINEVEGGSQPQVLLERWGKISTLFGPISREDPRQFFEKIRTVLRKPWYHGNVSREQVSFRLSLLVV